MKKHLKIIICLAIIAGLFQPFGLFAQEKTNPIDQSIELGNVQWYRNYDDAIALGKKEKKDIVILFQEVPGCVTCRNYGHNVLSHPLMVEALENSFIPLAIFNNKGGSDKKILEKFDEPSWNNPVVRIIDVNGNDIVKRISHDYSATTLIKRLKEALTVRKVQTPSYIDLLEQELVALQQTNTIKETTYSMYCFWTGEKKLGKINGVIDVESGFANNKEVVKVKYNNTLISKFQLDEYAKKQDFKSITNVENYKTATSDVHYYLQHSIYKYLPLSKVQQVKINSALDNKQSVKKYLSPKQLNWLNALQNGGIKKNNALFNKKIEDAWKLMEMGNIKSDKK